MQNRSTLDRRKRLAFESLESRRLLSAGVMITEFMASNDGVLRDGDGNASDWIELYNAGDESVDLAGYRLTDHATNGTKWTFPTFRLESGQYAVVFASDQDEDSYVDEQGSLHTNFALKKDGEYLALTDPDGIVVSEFGSRAADYPPQLRDVSYGVAQSVVLVDANSDATYTIPQDDTLGIRWTEREFDAAGHNFLPGKAAMGFESRPDDRFNFSGQFQTQLPREAHGVYARIEFDLSSASAVRALALRMKYDNGFIAYLNGVKVAEENAPNDPRWSSSATRVSLHDSEAVQFVQFDVGHHRSALVDGRNVLALHGMNHASDRSDMLLVPELIASVTDMHAAVGIEARVGYMTKPTPGAPNVSHDAVFAGFVADVQVSQARGFYDEPIAVEIAAETADAEIRYTTDGSTPTATHGQLYAGPLTIGTTTTLRVAAFTTGHIPSAVDSRTYIFPDHVLAQPAAPTGFPPRWGETQQADYEMDPDVTTNTSSSVYDPRVREALLSLPTVSLVTDQGHLFDPDTGIYSNPTWRGVAWERPVSFEYIEPETDRQTQVNAGLRIQGNSSRFQSNGKLNFRLLFKSDYGARKLEFPLFQDLDVDRFDTLILRGGYTDSWTSRISWIQESRAQYVRDQWHRDTQFAMGQTSTAHRYVHLYLNSLYWGLYSINQRPDASFHAQRFGGDKEEYDVLRDSGPPPDGDRQTWNEMMEIVEAGLETDESYSALQEHIDIPNLIDFMLLKFYSDGNGEWYAGRRRAAGARWTFITWDNETTFRTMDDDNTGIANFNQPSYIHERLTHNADYRMLLADHIHRHFFNGGALTPEATWDRYMARADEIRLALSAESARWGDSRRPNRPFTPDNEWLSELNWLRETYFPQRSGIVLDQLQARGLYPDVVAPSFNQHGGTVIPTHDILIDAPEGTIYVTTDGSDPRLPGGAISPSAVEFTGPVAIRDDTTIKARAIHDGQWSALNEAAFAPASLVPGDANMDGEFDRLDLLEVLQAGKYLTGQLATFAEGDWNRDGVFDQRDIATALQTHYDSHESFWRSLSSHERIQSVIQ